MPNKLSPHGKTIVEGSISWGTLRPQDLLTRFSAELKELKPFGEKDLQAETADLIVCLTEGQDDMQADYQEQALELLDTYHRIFNDACPEGMYFGTLEGDGSDFGFWHTEEENE